jgi:hypothetical protein
MSGFSCAAILMPMMQYNKIKLKRYLKAGRRHCREKLEVAPDIVLH